MTDKDVCILRKAANDLWQRGTAVQEKDNAYCDQDQGYPTRHLIRRHEGESPGKEGDRPKTRCEERQIEILNCEFSCYERCKHCFPQSHHYVPRLLLIVQIRLLRQYSRTKEITSFEGSWLHGEG